MEHFSGLGETFFLSFFWLSFSFLPGLVLLGQVVRPVDNVEEGEGAREKNPTERETKNQRNALIMSDRRGLVITLR